MAITFAQVGAGLREWGLRFSEPRDNVAVLLQQVSSTNLTIVISLEEDGDYLRMRTLDLAACPESHPKLAAVHAVLNQANLEQTGICFGWDNDDGEIVVEANLPLDGVRQFGKEQLQLLYATLCGSCGEWYPRIRTAIDGGSGGRSSDSTSERTSGSSKILAWGLMLLGLAALLAVLRLFVG